MQNDWQKERMKRRDERIFELAKEGFTMKQIAEKIADEYESKISRVRVSQIVTEKKANE